MIQNGKIRNQLGNELNEAIKVLKEDVYNNLKEIENDETVKKHDNGILRFINDLLHKFKLKV
jgi:hypothetical protein